MKIEAFAPAKINLTLHVTGQRADGYHLLDSLVMFADFGDRIWVEQADETTLDVTGPLAGPVPTDSRNLVRRAADFLGVTAKITLEKNLPAAAGIGGGSSDAAATLRALCALYDLPLPSEDAALALGADVPVCLQGGWARMSGIGGDVARLGAGAAWPMLLINPRVAVSTPDVFRGLNAKTNAPMPDQMPAWSDREAALEWLATQRNDLQAPAIALEPIIAEALRLLESSEGCQLARMSGSGATCFAIFTDGMARDAAAEKIRAEQPNWWIQPVQHCGTSWR